jgi:hypothetical protein
MVIFVPKLLKSSAPPAAKPLFERTLNVVGGQGIRLLYRGLWLYFSADRERVYTPLLVAGKLKFVAFADRVELHQLNGEGVTKVLGRALLDADNQFFLHGELVSDKHGPVKGRTNKPYRHVAAEVLFPEIGKVRRLNRYEAPNRRAELVYGKQKFTLPTGQHAHYGAAVREQRIAAIASSQKIDFFEQTAAGVDEYIGTIELTDPRIGRQERVRADEYIEKFALHDLPVKFSGGDIRVEHRGIVFVFSGDPKNVYFRDIFAERIFLRVGFRDRIEVIRKDRGDELLIGSFPTKGLPLDRPARSGNYLRVDTLIEEMSAREVTVRATPNFKNVMVRAHNILLHFPMRAGNYYRDAIVAGKMVCRISRDRIAVGLAEERRFDEIGRIELGRRLKLSGKSVNIERLIPELGRIEKRAGLDLAGAIMHREIRYLFDLAPGDFYYNDLLAGRIVFRAIGRRVEIFVEREAGKREYLGDFRLNRDNQLETQSGELYQIGRGPVAAGERRDARVSRLIGAFKAGEQEIVEVLQRLADDSYDDLYQIFTNGQSRRWLKLFTLVGKGYLASSEADEVIAVKILYALAFGLDNLANPNQLSPDLKKAFTREIVETMALAFNNQVFHRVRESLRVQYERALLAAQKINQAL